METPTVWSALLAEPVSALLTTGFLGKHHNALEADVTLNDEI